MTIGVFCSANKDIDPEFFRRAEQLGSWIGRNGHNLVFGGCDMGLMQCVARAAHDAGALTIGVVPTIIERGGRVSEYVDVKVLCDNLSDRKDLMTAKSDVLVALPGGIGTLDEIFTVAASASLGYTNKRVVLYNINSFWQPLIAMLDAMSAVGMLRSSTRETICVASSIDEIAALL